MMMQVSNEMVRIYKEQFGRGPTRVRPDFAGLDAILCTLQDTFTPAERNRVKPGEHARLRGVRMFFQYASEEEFRTAVENITGRKVCRLSAVWTPAQTWQSRCSTSNLSALRRLSA